MTEAIGGGSAAAAPPGPAPAPEPVADERLANIGMWARLMRRPEVGSLLGALIVCAFFWVTTDAFGTLSGIANWTDVASTIGIVAVAVALLMIGGEFDLSAGVMTGTSGLTTGILSTYYGWNLWAAILAALLLAAAIGFGNGYLVVRTGLPSFIITLGSFLMLQGLNIGITKLVTDTVQVNAIEQTTGYGAAKTIFASTVTIAGTPFQIAILWWVAITAVGSWVLLRTRFGNWTFA